MPSKVLMYAGHNYIHTLYTKYRVALNKLHNNGMLNTLKPV